MKILNNFIRNFFSSFYLMFAFYLLNEVNGALFIFVIIILILIIMSEAKKWTGEQTSEWIEKGIIVYRIIKLCGVLFASLINGIIHFHFHIVNYLHTIYKNACLLFIICHVLLFLLVLRDYKLFVSLWDKRNPSGSKKVKLNFFSKNFAR